MARTLNKLSDVAVKAAKQSGRHSDGGGLYLNVSPTGTKSWLFMWTVDGKRREMGMGSYPAVSLSKARAKANDCREAVAEGRDPIAEKAKEAEPTFGECAEKFIESIKAEWRNDKHEYQWRQTLGDSYCQSLRSKRVSQITTEDVLKVLTPVWTAKSETASRLRGRIERVLEYAKVKGWRSGENPAAWRGNLRNLLPRRQKLQRGHQPAGAEIAHAAVARHQHHPHHHRHHGAVELCQQQACQRQRGRSAGGTQDQARKMMSHRYSRLLLMRAS